MFYEDDLFEECLERIDAWKPKEFSSELEYRNDLRNFLFSNLNKDNEENTINVKIEASRSLCDIAVGREVGIELKFGKNGKIRKAEIDRLHGQVEGHTREYSEGVIVVLVGDVNKYTVAEVNEKLKKLHYLLNQEEEYPMGLKNKSYSKVKAQIKKEKEDDEDDWGF